VSQWRDGVRTSGTIPEKNPSSPGGVLISLEEETDGPLNAGRIIGVIPSGSNDTPYNMGPTVIPGSEGKPIYVSGDNQVDLARSNVEATMPCRGFITAINSPDPGKCMIRNYGDIDADLTGISANDDVYVSPFIAGNLVKIPSDDPGSVSQSVGFSTTGGALGKLFIKLDEPAVQA